MQIIINLYLHFPDEVTNLLCLFQDSKSVSGFETIQANNVFARLY